jgi:hypothetical protein
MKVRDLQDAIWGRIGEQWLVGKGAAALLATCAVISIVGAVALIRWCPEGGSCPILVVLVAFGGLFVMSAMERFWIKCDQGSKVARSAWFVVLTLGLWFGASLYYMFVYLPQVRRNWRLQ